MAGNGKVLKWSLLKLPGDVLQATVSSVSVPLESMLPDGPAYQRRFEDDLRAVGSFDRIDILIDSMGGLVDSAAGMSSAILATKKPVRVLIQGACGSAATLIAYGTAAKTICITHSGKLVFHMPRVEGYGHTKSGVWKLIYSFSRLGTVNAMVGLYRARSKRFSRAELKQMMSEERLLSAHEAVEAGFADKIVTLDAFQRGAV